MHGFGSFEDADPGDTGYRLSWDDGGDGGTGDGTGIAADDGAGCSEVDETLRSVRD